MKKDKNKKVLTTFEEFQQSLTPKQKKEYEKECRELLLSELLLALMENDSVSVRELAREAGISPAIIQGIRSGTKENITLKTFFKILNAFGYDKMVIQRGKQKFPIEIAQS